MRKLNCHSLARSLNSLCKFLHDTYSVNYGGCCFLAYLIAQHLDQLGLEYDLVIYDDCHKDRVSIEHEVLSRHRNKGFHNSVTGPHSCSHYCLQLRGAGVINSDDDDEGEHRYTIPDVSYKNIRWIYRNSEWNSRYEVRHNKTIKNIVKEFFKEYEKIPLHKVVYLPSV